MILNLEEIEDNNECSEKVVDDSVEISKIRQLLCLEDLKYISPIIKHILDIQPDKIEYIFNNEVNNFSYRVILYLRLSVEDGDLVEGNVSKSIRNQLLLLLDESRKKNWKIVGIFCEEGISGGNDNRPEWKKSLNFCKQKMTDIFLCKSQSRFSRSMEMIEKYLHKEFTNWGIRFVSIVDNADTSIQGNKKARQINALTNEWQIEETSASIRRIFKNKKENGLFVSSNPPYRLFERSK